MSLSRMELLNLRLPYLIIPPQINDILNAMRVLGGKPLMEQQWQALKSTEVNAEQPDIPATWYHSCYSWSIISMASFMLARQSAREARQTLFYVQAVDQAKDLIPETNKAQC